MKLTLNVVEFSPECKGEVELNDPLISAIEKSALKAQKTLPSSDDDLYASLGARITAISSSPSIAGEFTPDASNLRRGSREELVKLGRRIFDQWNATLFAFLCGNNSDLATERDRLFHAVLGKEASAAAIATGILVSHFGVAPAIATVLGSILIKVLLVPAEQTVCEYWKEHLPASRHV